MLRNNYSLKLLLFPQKIIFIAIIQVHALFCSIKLQFPYYTVAPSAHIHLLYFQRLCPYGNYDIQHNCQRYLNYPKLRSLKPFMSSWIHTPQKASNCNSDTRFWTTFLQVCDLPFVCTQSNQRMTCEDCKGTHIKTVSHIMLLNHHLVNRKSHFHPALLMRWETPESASKSTYFYR